MTNWHIYCFTSLKLTMLERKRNIKRIYWWLGGILGAILVIIGIAAIYFSAKWKPLISKELKQGVYEGSEKLYTLDFKDIHLNILTGSATIDSLTLTPDTAVFNQLKAKRLAPTHTFQVKLAKLRVRRVGILSAYFNKKVDLTDIILDKPSINMIYNKVPVEQDTVKPEKTLYEQISKSIKSLHIDAIKIVDADFDYINGATSKPLNSVKHLNVIIKDVLIDSLADRDTTRLYYTKDIAFSLAGYSSLSKNKAYTMKVDTIKGSASDRTISIKGLKMIPMSSELSFTRKYKKEHFNLDFKEIRLKGVNFRKLNREGHLQANSVNLGPANVIIFMNREIPPPGFDKAKNFPHMALKRLQLPIIIDTVKLSNIDVEYTEYNPITRKRGTVFLQNLNGKILNLTNDSARLSSNNHAIANLSTKVMKAADLSITIDFNLTDNNGAFSYKGHVGSLDMTVLNPLSKPLGLIEIESGSVQKADFNVDANLNGSTGTMRFLYKDLKVSLMKQPDDGEAPKDQGLLSFLANTILIKDANPTPGEAPRTAKITFERTPAASFFNQLWKGVFIGMRETAGIGIVPVKSPEKAHKKVAEKKEERQEKREERREKRAERKAEREKN